MDEEGKPVELHEGHLTNVVAQARAKGDKAEVADVFAALEKENPYRPVEDEAVTWAPDVARQKQQERKEREVRASIAAAEAQDG